MDSANGVWCLAAFRKEKCLGLWLNKAIPNTDLNCNAASVWVFYSYSVYFLQLPFAFSMGYFFLLRSIFLLVTSKRSISSVLQR